MIMKKIISPYFHLSEFFVKCSKSEKEIALQTPIVLVNLFSLAMLMQSLRYFVGIPVIITSGYRDIEHNKRVGGVSSSQHLNGSACDFVCKGYGKQGIIRWFETCAEFDQLIVYDTFFHVSYNNEHNRNQIICK